MPMFRKILHANDGSEHAFHALAAALAMAKQLHGELHMILVEEISDFPEIISEVKNEKAAADRAFRKVIKRAEEMAEAQHVKLHVHMRTGHPVRTIIEVAQELQADLLVIGARGHSAFYERIVGSKADRLVQLAPCAVLVVK
jgi:nucleotide-binding universal stress UspA family protein